jgi:hypothetical protein
MTTRGRLLIAYSTMSSHVTATREYIEAFAKHADWDVSYVNVTGGAELRFDLNEFDAVLQNYCARMCFENYVSTHFLKALKEFRGVRVFAVQDEYDHTNMLRDAIRDLGFHIVLTCVPQDGLEYVYPRAMFPGTDFITVLTGYVSDAVGPQRRVPLRERPTAIGYRGRDIGARYGRLGLDKFEIGRRMREICETRGIRHDIEWTEEKRVYGDAWYHFIRSCQAMLGSESGSNVFDFDGSIERHYQALKAESGTVNYESFKDVTEPREREIEMGQISPRVFEAAAQWTPLVLFKGRYSGAIRPGEHYIELEKDFSNVDDVLRRIENLDELEAMATRAHDHLIASGAFSYRHFVQSVEQAIEAKHRNLAGAGALRTTPYPRRSESHTDFGEDVDVIGETPTSAPRGIVYFHYQQKVLELRIYQEERVRLAAEIARLNTVYPEDRERLVSEIQRLNTVYAEDRQRLVSEIERLNAVRTEELLVAAAGVKAHRGNSVVLDSVARRLSGPGAMASLGSTLRRVASLPIRALRNPALACRRAVSFVRDWVAEDRVRP